MATAEYVTPAELQAELKELDKKQESRLYTVRDQLRGDMSKMETRILAEIQNGHKQTV